MYKRPMQETNLVATIGLIAMGIAIGTAWLWIANPDVLRSILNGLGSGHWVALAGLIFVALIGVSFLRQLVFAFLQFIGVLMRLAVLAMVVAGGLFLWRSTRSGPVNQRPLSESWSPRAAPAAVMPEVSPEQRRTELEAELLKLDRQSGSSWWQAK
jgi:hypothetical protein